MEKNAGTKSKKSGAVKKSPKEPSSAKKSAKKDFLVVGLGASAGGVKALQEFFALMPPNSGMAFVAILHLSPEHESSLPQILQAQTAMKVVPVTEEIKVAPNNVYVIPPNVQLEMVDGVIRPAAPDRPHGQRVAIDVFFRTLAEAYEKNAVCVVLSGTGSDGTLGLKRVKEANGFAIVQDPEDAEYDSMPRSAISTQLANWILPVNRMPDKLINFRESSERLHLTNGADAAKVAEEINADESLREILKILRVRTGHDFSSYKTPTLVRRVARHLQIHELEDLPTYLEILRRKPDEVQSLLKNLLINVTNFFRDKEAFESLQREVVPKIFDGKTGRDTVRVWSCGCASGEEAYSLAMILQEHADTLPDPPKFQVFASDVDEEALREAREHRYPESIETDVSPERLKRFFTKEGAYYRVKKELRERVLCAPHDVLRDPPFSRLDLIACRNLLIYLNRDAQERVLQTFHFALQSTGYLFLGGSESAESVSILFAPVNKKHRFYSRRAASPIQKFLPVMPVAGRWEIPLPDAKSSSVPDRAATLGEIYYQLLQDYAPSGVLVNQDFDIVYTSGTADRFLRFTKGEPSKNILKAINPDLLPDLRAALFTAQREHQSAEFPNIRVEVGDQETYVDLIVRAIDVTTEARDFLLVIFEERGDSITSVRGEKRHKTEKKTDKTDAAETVTRHLEEDLQKTRERLRITIEQHETALEEHKAANEELQATIEELRSAGEELETSKEELQSVNEELVTVNHEFKEKAEEAARINSDLSNLVSSTDIATIFLDKSLKIKRYTPPVEQLFNITPLDIGRPLEHFTHHLDFERMTDEAGRVLRSLKPAERETADEQGNSYLARFLPYRTIDDRIEGVVLNFIDITMRKRAENRVRESEAAFRIISNAAPALVWVCDAGGANIYFNEQWFEYTGQTKRDAEGDGWTTTLHPDDAAAIVPYWERCRQTGEIYEGEVRYRRADGEYRWHHFRALPHRNQAGEIEAWYGVSVDIHDSKTAETAIHESENHFRAFVTSSSDAVYSMSADWSEMRFLEGKDFLPDTEDANRNWLEKYILPEDRAQILHIINEAIRTKSIFELEHRVIRMGGGFGWTYSRAIPITDEAGEIVEWFGTASDITTNKETGEALIESEEKYRTLFDSMDEGFCVIEMIFDGKGKAADCLFLETNPAFERQSGLKNVIGKRMKEIEPKHEEFWFETYGRIVRTGESLRFENEAAALGRWFDVNAFRIGAPGENRVAIFFTDITERKQSEQFLRESEERFRNVFSNDMVPMGVWTKDSGILNANDALLNLIGDTRRKLEAGQINWLEITPSEFHERDRQAVAEVEERGFCAPYEKVFVHKDGRGIPIFIGGGRFNESTGAGIFFAIDVSERQHAEEALRKSQEQLHLILESIKDYAIITFDLNGYITRWNTGAQQIFGYTEKEAIGRYLAFLFTPEDQSQDIHEQEMKTALEKGRAEDERWHIRKNGSRFFASGVMQPLRDSKTEGFVKIARDQTEKIAAEAAVREKETLQKLVSAQEDARRRIARDLHDELGQQLIALRVKLDEVKKSSKGDDALLVRLNDIQEIARSIDDGIDFLAWELRPSMLDDLGLVAALDNHIKQWSHYSGVKTDFVVSNLKRARFAPEVETCLYRITQEALNNTHKHAKATKVEVVLEKRGELLVLIIEDNGKGFNRKNKATAQQGIGLIGMKERAALVGGTFEVESAPKKGTTVYVRILLATAKDKNENGEKS